MNTSTLLTGVTGSTITTSATVKEDGTIDTQTRNSILGTVVSTTATAVAGASLNAHGTKEIYQKYAQAYVESMSDEELETALSQMNLLIQENEQNNNIKTL